MIQRTVTSNHRSPAMNESYKIRLFPLKPWIQKHFNNLISNLRFAILIFKKAERYLKNSNFFEE